MEPRPIPAASLVTIERAIAEAEGILQRQQAALARLEAARAPTATSRAFIQTMEETLDWLRAARADAILAATLARMMLPTGSPQHERPR